MSYVTVLADEQPVARKQHQCEMCWGHIGAGDQYRRQRNVGDDGPYVFKAHALCWALSVFIARELDYWTDEGEWPEPSEVRDGLIRWFAAWTPAPAASSEGS